MALPQMQHAADSKHCRSCGHAYEYEADLPRASRPLPLPAVRRSAAPIPTSSPSTCGSTARATPPSRCGSAPRARRSRSPCPASTTSTTRSARPRCATRSACRSSEIVAGLGAVEAAFGRAETIELDGRPLSILLIKNPAGRERGAAHARARGRRDRPARGAQRQRRRRARRLVGVGRRLRAARRPRAAGHVRRHARERAGGAARSTRASTRSASSSSRSWPTRSTRRTRDGAGPLYALPTYTALLALRDLLARRGVAPEYWR